MGFLTMAAALAAAEVAVAPPPPPPGEAALRVFVETVEVGDGSALVQAVAGYATGRASVLVSGRWQKSPVAWLPDTADVSLAAEREVDARTRIGVEAWRGLGRFSGGAGVALTWTRALR